jgi:hypothetical protein
MMMLPLPFASPPLLVSACCVGGVCIARGLLCSIALRRRSACVLQAGKTKMYGVAYGLRLGFAACTLNVTMWLQCYQSHGIYHLLLVLLLHGLLIVVASSSLSIAVAYRRLQHHRGLIVVLAIAHCVSLVVRLVSHVAKYFRLLQEMFYIYFRIAASLSRT